MKGADILRLVDTIHREKNIEKEVVFEGLENALFSAARKKLGNANDIFIEIDRKTGDITAFDGEEQIDPTTLGRIAALTAKQVMIQKFREAERDVVFSEYIRKVGTLLTGTIQRVERPNVIINFGRAEGIIPWREQVPTESHNVGDRIKCLVLEVKKVRQQVRIILSRASPNLLRHLFELEVPEVAERIIEIRELARDAGHRSKVAVQSIDHNVDCVGACVGIRGSRIKNIVDELNGEKIDIVRWNESTEVFIRNSMKPAEINAISLDFEKKHAKLFVNEDQLSLAIGRRGQNVRLASALTGWDLDLLTGTPDSYEERFQVAGKERRREKAPENKLDSILPSAQGSESNAPAASPTSAKSKLDALISTPTAVTETSTEKEQQESSDTASVTQESPSE
ncbi:MAG: transcription termination factor NusA [Planctomycetota bacterium]|nr:transcription termination factor NusA [Planctomycetota bacterium]